MNEFSKQFPEMNLSIESIVAIGNAGEGRWKQMSDTERIPYIAEEEKRKLEYEKRTNAYSRLVAVVDTEEEKSDKSRSEFDDKEESGEEEDDDDLCNISYV
ncbi:high mobility group B protein 2-like [Lycium barbarum]|uniref:high mobility group B protein 2-like n=1 Tax=Lycium barbarum TaxID=112863 RepID=UPI00293E0E08|nr:high mobility group B protein 2-like [Lycium barbarum]